MRIAAFDNMRILSFNHEAKFPVPSIDDIVSFRHPAEAGVACAWAVHG
jgi:hypothetical protein